ncbi:MAG: sodium/solute symporter [Sedimentisphaerales bacterium]|nr:sodium/solute symporter [Sedimentisphaerales bacterium]
MDSFALEGWDYFAFALYFVLLCAIGFWAGRKEKTDSEDYFLAGRTLPWYVVGTSFIASNISTEHFIGMIGAAFIYGVSIAMYEWGNINSFSVLIWLFIPFLLATKIFTTPEFLEKRFNNFLRQFFAIVTVICNIVAFLAAVLYGGGLALRELFSGSISKVTAPLAEHFVQPENMARILPEINLWVCIIVLGVVAGSWAIYGGLKSVAWTDFYTVIIMIAGGLLVTIFGLYMISGDSHSLLEGFKIMIERNRGDSGIYAKAAVEHAQHIVQQDHYNRLSVIQPVSHETLPWPSLFYGFLATGLWYSVLNQFMIQRVLAAKNMYHARMGIVLAGYMKILMPLIVVVPGLILFARYPEVMFQPWEHVRDEADKGYIVMLQTIVPIGLRGLFLAALFGAIQSTVNSVLNSTATIVTLDIYKRMFHKQATEKHFVRVGVWTSVVILFIAIVMGGFIKYFKGGLFEYIQSLYAFFAPPFSAIFLLGILFRRINAKGASFTVVAGFAFGVLMKLYLSSYPGLFGDVVYKFVKPYSNQSLIHWLFCVICCVIVSLTTAPPRSEQVTDQLTFNWRKSNIFDQLGDKWYTSVIFWWGLFVAIILALVVIFSGHAL